MSDAPIQQASIKDEEKSTHQKYIIAAVGRCLTKVELNHYKKNYKNGGAPIAATMINVGRNQRTEEKYCSDSFVTAEEFYQSLQRPKKGFAAVDPELLKKDLNHCKGQNTLVRRSANMTWRYEAAIRTRTQAP